jgi:hypothetical protein
MLKNKFKTLKVKHIITEKIYKDSMLTYPPCEIISFIEINNYDIITYSYNKHYLTYKN